MSLIALYPNHHPSLISDTRYAILILPRSYVVSNLPTMEINIPRTFDA